MSLNFPTTTYTYDANGNRASKSAGGTTETYVVDDADKLTSITVGGSAVKTYGYDAAGRTTSVATSAGTTTLAYDYEGRISTITYPSSATNSFTYNGLDTRVGKVDSAGTTTYRRDGDDVLSPVLEAGGTKFTPGISRRTGTSSYFYHQDRMGSAIRQTNSTQGSLTSRQYDAFGNVAYEGGTWVGSFGFVGGEGYQEDSDSGLTLLGHRYYDSSTGRFLTRDPIKDGRNWYGYVENNPLRWIDPEGLVKITLCFREVLLGAYHSYIIIEDNVQGSLTFGQQWIVSGGPRKTDLNPGKLIDHSGDPSNRDNYDRGYGDERRKIVLRNDDSDFKGWKEAAQNASGQIDGTEGYNPIGTNSNSFAREILQRLGLLPRLGDLIGGARPKFRLPHVPGWSSDPWK